MSTLNVADVGPAQAGVLGEVILIPASRLSQFPNALPHSGTNIRTCHPSSMDVSFWLYFAKWLHLLDLLLIVEGRWENDFESLFSHACWPSRAVAGAPTAEPVPQQRQRLPPRQERATCL